MARRHRHASFPAPPSRIKAQVTLPGPDESGPFCGSAGEPIATARLAGFSSPRRRSYTACRTILDLLQSYIWQDYDLAPHFPKLVSFLGFWAANLDGPLYRVRVAHRRLIAPQEFNFVEGELRPN